MKFTQLLDIVGDDPVFSSSLLLAGDVDKVDIASQLSRWVASGKIVSLRRGVYIVSQRYRRREPHSFEIANRLVEPSYVSLESALSFHGLIPEAVFTTTSVTRGRPSVHDTDLGRFSYRAISADLFWGYATMRVAETPVRTALVARPEKALLDLVHLRPGGDDPAFLEQLRLDRLDTLDLDLLAQYAKRSGKPKLERACGVVARMATEYSEGWVTA